ncbi:MAG: Phosphotransferase enzyme family [Pseudomonadota bacterium]|jgi:thiamine kinase-like enzyme
MTADPRHPPSVARFAGLSGHAGHRSDFFAWLAPDHPFQHSLRPLGEAIAQDSAAQALLHAGRRSDTLLQIHVELQAGRLPNGLWMPAYCSWSAQLQDPSARLGLRTRTLSWHGTGAERTPQWHELPQDPRLSQAQTWFDRHATLGRTRVLRYVPQRRITFAWQDEQGQALIGRFMRRSRHGAVQRLLARISTLVELGRPGFAVAQPGPVEPDAGLYFQTQLNGIDLASWLAPSTSARGPALARELAQCRGAMAHVGRLHARLHALPVNLPQLPVATDLAERLAAARAHLAFIGVMQPGYSQTLGSIDARLQRLPAWHDSQARLCHGDLMCSQFLVDGLGPLNLQDAVSGPGALSRAIPTDPDCWSVTDFDHCHLGDPCRDLALLLASLAHDLPGLAELDRSQPERVDRWLAEVCPAYLQAYVAETGAALAQDRLIWHSLCAELHFLALMLRRDTFHPAAFERRLRHAQALCSARSWV